MALWQAYFDESERESGVFCVAGYAFVPEQAKKFTKEWKRLFADYPAAYTCAISPIAAASSGE